MGDYVRILMTVYKLVVRMSSSFCKAKRRSMYRLVPKYKWYPQSGNLYPAGRKK